jgi:hypothetical protein
VTTVSLPNTLAAFTPEWITWALQEQGLIGDSRVTEVQTEPIGQGVGVLCQLARLTLTYDRPPASGPATVVVKIPSGDPQTRAMASAFQFYEREVRFYAELAAQVALRTPHCYYHAFDSASGDFVLMLEDMAFARLADQLQACPLEEAQIAIDELVKLHAEWWDSPKLAELTWVPESRDPINKAGLAFYPAAWPLFVERFGKDLPADILSIGERIGAQATAILDRFSTGPMTLCHGDYRADNFFFARREGDAPLAIIDWQIAIRGVGTYDVGYFMTQSMDIAVRRAHEMDLLKRYHAGLVERGVKGYSFDQCLVDYRWTVLFCFAYPVMGGGLGDLSNERGHALAAAMMHRSAAAIADWKAGELLAP